MSISDKLLEFTSSLNEIDKSDRDYYSQMDMADKMSMGMGGLGTLYGSAAEQAGQSVQDWSKQNLSPEAMNQAGIALSNTASNWTPEQTQVFEGIQNIPSQMIQPVRHPEMPQQPQLTQTQKNVIAGENSMNRMQQEVDYAKAQQAKNAGIPSISSESLNNASGKSQEIVQQAVIDQTDDIDDTAQAAKETEGWSEEHFRGAIKVIDSLLQQTNPQSAEYMSLQNRKADLIRVYESQKGSDDPYRAMEQQVATNQMNTQKDNEAAEMQLLANEQENAARQSKAIQDYNRYAPEMAHSSTAGEMEARDYFDKATGAGEVATRDEERYGTGDAVPQAYTPASESTRDTSPTTRERINMTLEGANDTQGTSILDTIHAEEEAAAQAKNTSELITNARTSTDVTPAWLGTHDTPREKADQAADQAADAVHQNIVDTAMDEPTFPDTDKGDGDRLAYQAQDAGFDNVQDYLADAETTPGANVGAGWKDKTADNQMKAIEHQFSKLDKEVASRITKAVQTPPPPWDETGVASVNNTKKAVTESVLNEDGSIKSSADLRGVSAKIFKEAMALENMKNADRDWGPAMMQFGLTLMSTPGNLLTGIGIAGKDALKMWRDIKKGDKTAATAKKELALKYATLADTKDKEGKTKGLQKVMINNPDTGESRAGSYNPENGVYTYSDGTEVPTNAKIYTIQASGNTDELGLTNTQSGKVTLNLKRGQLLQEKIAHIMTAVEENPTAIGGVGELTGVLRGVVGQGDNLAGTSFASNIPEVTDVRGQFKQLRPMMIKYLEGIGRYNKTTETMIDDLFAGLDRTTSAEQTMTQLRNIYKQIAREQSTYQTLLDGMDRNKNGAVILTNSSMLKRLAVGTIVVDSKGNEVAVTQAMKDRYATNKGK